MNLGNKLFAVLAMVAASGSVASARASFVAPTDYSCNGKVVIDTVYQTEVKSRPGTYDYYFQIRNTKNIAVKADVRLGGFPGTVSIFSPGLNGITLDGNQNKQIKFGSGTNNQINAGSVRKLYDSAGGGSGPFVAVNNCKA